MAITLFDLDNTLITGDSDHLWGEFLVKNKVVDPKWYKRKNDQFFTDYQSGNLDINQWLAFQVKPLTKTPSDELFDLREQFIETEIKPRLLEKAQAEIKKHRNNILVIITATNDFLTRPIADLFEIDTLIATKFEFKNNQYTGKIIGTPTFQEGKVTRLNQWLQEQNLNLTDSYFYSDSHNDIPLLNIVDQPIAVDPDKKLSAHAKQAGWPILSFR